MLWDLRTKFLTESASVMRQYDPKDESSFAAIVSSCLAAGLKPMALADEFKVSSATISRWQSGKSIPAELVRGVVVNRLIDLLIGAAPMAVRRAS
jgi:hypothetical protein